MKRFKIIVRELATGQTIDEQDFSHHKPYLGYFTSLGRKGWNIDKEQTETTVWVSRDDLFSGGGHDG